MARRDARNWHDCMKMFGVLCLLTSILAGQVASSLVVDVEPAVEAYLGQTVNLRCGFTDATGQQPTMVTWIYEPREGERINIAVLHPKFAPNYPDSPVKGRVSFSSSPPDLASPSIQITDVRMNDEGRYICEYATYPIGNEQGVTQLVMLARPQNWASILTVNAGTKPVVVARCESGDGRPAAKISWVTTANGNGTTVSKSGADNTVTVTSEYTMIPTAADNGKDISCVIAHRTHTKPHSFPSKLVVRYAPKVTITGYDNNWYVGRTNVLLTCEANSNPVPISVQWKTMSGEWPDTVQVQGNKLKVLKVDESVNTTFVCEFRNLIGTGRDKVEVFVRAIPKLLFNVPGQQVVVQPKVSFYPGQTGSLSCTITGIHISQVMWIYESEYGERSYIAMFHPKFGPNYPESPVQDRVSFSPSPPDLNSPSIQIRNAKKTDEGKYICEYATYPFGIKQGITQLVIMAMPNAPQVDVEPVVESSPRQTVNLRCALTNATGISLTQVMWIYESKDRERSYIAMFHPKFEANYPESPVHGRVSFSPSPPDLNSPSIQIHNVKKTDEGMYICEFATYPLGNTQGITRLVILERSFK